MVGDNQDPIRLYSVPWDSRGVLRALMCAAGGERVTVWCFDQKAADSYREELLKVAEEYGVDPSLITIHVSTGEVAGKKPDSIVVDEVDHER